ncbi:MAG: DUF166 domain-containing protein [Candidatus Hodarchaeota archaeon]
MQLYFFYSDVFASRCIGHLINNREFCKACGTDSCTHCRDGYGSFAANIIGIEELPLNIPSFIEDSIEYFPEDLPECDVILPIGIHPDLLLGITDIAVKMNSKAVIVPIEEPRWAPIGLQQQIKDELTEIGIEVVFPKPFCGLTPGHSPIIDQFIKTFKIGRPKIEIDYENGQISNVRVLCSAPCGGTYYVAQQLKWSNNQYPDLPIEEVASKAWHSYPCTGSMVNDSQINDTILHRAGYLTREALFKALEKAGVKYEPILPIPEEFVYEAIQ